MGQPIVAAAAPVILPGSPRRLSDGQFQFTFSGIEGRRYQVYASTDLAEWSLLQDVEMTGSTAVVVDPEPGATRRFYRVVAP